MVRVGCTRLRLIDVPDDEGLVDRTVRLRVDSFDETRHAGRATYLETVGTSAF